MQSKQVAAVSIFGLKRNIFLDLFHCEDGLSGSDCSQQGNLYRAAARQAYGPVEVFLPHNIAALFQLLQVFVDGRGGFDL